MSDSILLPLWADAEASRTLPLLCAQGEGQSIEFKEAVPTQAHDIAKSIAAFASSNAGQLLYGVTDHGTIVGLPEALDAGWRDRLHQRVMNAAREIKPPVHPTLVWAVQGEKVVCVVRVEKGFEAIYYTNQRPIIRRGNTSRPAEPGEVEHAFRVRYAAGKNLAPLPSTRQIAERMSGVLKMMNVRRYEALTVVDLALAMGLSSPAELDAVFSGGVAATFAMLDQFCARFSIDKEWLMTGRSAPFTSPIEHRMLPEQYLSLIEEGAPETVFLVRSRSIVGEAFIVVESDPLKFWRLPDVWHVSDHVGGGGSRDLLSLYDLFKAWSSAMKSYNVLGRVVEPALAESLFNGNTFPGVVAAMPLSHWWDDLTDIEHRWTTRERSKDAYGKNFVAAQDIIRAMLDRRNR